MHGRTLEAIIFLFLGLSGGTAFGQPIVWAVGAGGLDIDNGQRIALDGDGNSYVTGRFAGTATFGAGEPNETVLTSDGDADLFLARYDGSGLLVWATRAGGTLFEIGDALALDGAGDVYLTGFFNGISTFGAGEPNETVLTSAGEIEIFLARYDGDSGSLVWATQAGGTGFDRGNDLAIDGTGHVYLTGFFSGTATFGAGEPNETVLTDASGADLFVARYDGSGTLAWATQAGGIDFAAARGIAVDGSGTSCVTGLFRNSATFGAGEPNETVLTSAGLNDVFVAAYDASGQLVWATRAGGTDFDEAEAAALDGAGFCVVGGRFWDTATFGAGEANETVLPTLGDEESFIAKYDGSGRLMWATGAGGPSFDAGLDVATGDAGQSYLTGYFHGTATFGAGEPSETVLTSAGSRDVFLAEYDASGLLVAATHAGGAATDTALGRGLGVDGAGHVYAIGSYLGTITFGAGGPGEIELVSSGSNDVFVAKFTAVTVFSDGFEAGSATFWSAVVP